MKTCGFLAMTLSRSSHAQPNTFTPAIDDMFTPSPKEDDWGEGSGFCIQNRESLLQNVYVCCRISNIV